MSSGSVGKAIVPRCFYFGQLLATQGNGGVFCTGSYGRHRRQWFKYQCTLHGELIA